MSECKPLPRSRRGEHGATHLPECGDDAGQRGAPHRLDRGVGAERGVEPHRGQHRGAALDVAAQVENEGKT